MSRRPATIICQRASPSTNAALSNRRANAWPTEVLPAACAPTTRTALGSAAARLTVTGWPETSVLSSHTDRQFRRVSWVSCALRCAQRYAAHTTSGRTGSGAGNAHLWRARARRGTDGLRSGWRRRNGCSRGAIHDAVLMTATHSTGDGCIARATTRQTDHLQPASHHPADPT